MSSSPYDSKTYSFIGLNTVNFTESQVKNDKIFKNPIKNLFFSARSPARAGATRPPHVAKHCGQVAGRGH